MTHTSKNDPQMDFHVFLTWFSPAFRSHSSALCWCPPGIPRWVWIMLWNADSPCRTLIPHSKPLHPCWSVRQLNKSIVSSPGTTFHLSAFHCDRKGCKSHTYTIQQWEWTRERVRERERETKEKRCWEREWYRCGCSSPYHLLWMLLYWYWLEASK